MSEVGPNQTVTVGPNQTDRATYADDVLMPEMDQAVLTEIKRFEAEGTTDDPRYEQLLMEHHYVLHVCRLPIEDWPDPVTRSLAHINPAIYVPSKAPAKSG